ncbi:MAG: molybdenum cofactor guanylyltransferase [Candidatus Heimdallarchaeota archaeon]|nr:molybdenum cofactor guanylyltransferase [Candidatus Heimdallarchaeota archaeon]
MITAIVLAGGESTRFGSSKQLFIIDGLTMVEQVISNISAFADRILVSATSSNASEIRKLINFHVIEDKESIEGIHIGDLGPMTGILSILNKTEAGIVLLSPSDTPYIDGDIYDLMIEQLESSDLVTFMDKDGNISSLNLAFRFSPFIWQKLLQLVQMKRKNKVPVRPTDILLLFDTVSLLCYNQDRRFTNINRPEDVESLQNSSELTIKQVVQPRWDGSWPIEVEDYMEIWKGTQFYRQLKRDYLK